MTVSRRQALLAWAEQHDAAILEDDYDSEFRLSDRPLEPLRTLDAAGRVVYIGSFSKTLLPNLRLGFIIAPRSLLGAIHRAKFLTDWHSPTLLQTVLAPFHRHRRLRPAPSSHRPPLSGATRTHRPRPVA